jgi:hypothetical protein
VTNLHCFPAKKPDLFKHELLVQKKGADDDAIDLERGDKRRGPPGRSKSGRDDVEIVDEEDAGYPEMSNFFSEVASIKSSLKKMGTNVKALEEAYQDSLQKTSTADKKGSFQLFFRRFLLTE